MTAPIAILTERSLAEEKFRLAVEACPNGMVMFDGDGRMVMVNNEIEKQFGSRRDELVGQKVKSIIPQDFAEWPIADGLRSATDVPSMQ